MSDLPRLYLILEPDTALGPVETMRAACAAGVRLVQWRAKSLPARQVFEVARELALIAAAWRASLLINDRADIARSVAAAGVHLPEAGLPLGAARALLGASGVIGASTHDLAGLERARDANFATYSPIFETSSKPGYGPALGLEELAKAARVSPVPIYALGGITPARAQRCIDAGAHGVAVMGGITRAASPFDAATAYIDELARISF